MRQTFGVLGFCFKVVSSTHTIEDIQKEILLFVINIKALLLSLNQTQKQDEDYFNNNLIALEHNLSEPYKNLYCAASNKWSVIDDGTYQFDIKQQQLHFYKNQQKSIQKRIDLEAMLLFVDELFIQKAKLLIVYASKQLIKSFANIDIEPYAGRPIKFYQDHRKFHLENAFY